MKTTKKISSFLAALLCVGMLAGCGGNASSSENDSSSAVQTNEASTPAADNSDTESSSPAEDNSTEETLSINVTALKGPTAMGMTKLMEDDEVNGYPYEFTISAAVDEISPQVIQGKTDIVCVPANLGSVLYNKTEGGVKVLAINTLGVLYICENGSTVTSIEDLKGRTIFASGKAATPEYALNYILSQNGIDPEKDVTIEWKSEHSECLAALTTTEGSVALLPQPFVTTAQTKNEGINVVLDITEEWEKLNNGSACLTGAVIARTEFVEQNPEAVDEFLERYAQSVQYINENVPEAAQLV